MKELTTGKEEKVILKFTIPILIGNMFQQLYNTIDSIIVGNYLGKDALAVVSACFNIMMIILLIVIGLTLGTNMLIAKFFGAKDMKKLKIAIDTSFVLCFFLAIAITITGLLSSKYILAFFRVPSIIMPEADAFLRIMMIGTIASFGYNTISSILRGLGDSKTPLYFLIVSAVINIILDLLFIVVLRTDSLGAAVQKLFLSGGNIIIQILINGFGTNCMAAFAAAAKLDSFAQMPAANLGDALSIFTAQNLGADKSTRVRKGYKATIIIGSVLSLIITTIVLIFAKNLVSFFVKDSSVINIGAEYLKVVSLCYIFYSAMNITNGVNNNLFMVRANTNINIFKQQAWCKWNMAWCTCWMDLRVWYKIFIL